MDYSNLALNILVAAGSSSVFHLVFKEGIKARLRKEVESDLEKLRHELETKKEILKNDLVKDAYKAQLILNNIYSIYPELVSHLEICFGAVGGLQGLRYGIDFESLSEDGLSEYMEKKGYSTSTKTELRDRFVSDKREAASALRDYQRKLDVDEARLRCLEANNFRIMKAIYCSDAVIESFDACYKKVWDAWVDIKMGNLDAKLWARGSQAIHNEIPPLMDKFRESVRSELKME